MNFLFFCVPADSDFQYLKNILLEDIIFEKIFFFMYLGRILADKNKNFWKEKWFLIQGLFSGISGDILDFLRFLFKSRWFSESLGEVDKRKIILKENVFARIVFHVPLVDLAWSKIKNLKGEMNSYSKTPFFWTMYRPGKLMIITFNLILTHAVLCIVPGVGRYS